VDTLGDVVAGAAAPMANLCHSFAAFFGGTKEATAAGLKKPVLLLASTSFLPPFLDTNSALAS
jgi:hypothetical protein